MCFPKGGNYLEKLVFLLRALEVEDCGDSTRSEYLTVAVLAHVVPLEHEAE